MQSAAIDWPHLLYSRTFVKGLLAFVIAGLALWGLNRTLFGKQARTREEYNSSHGLEEDTDPVRFYIASNSAMFAVLGMAVTVSASAKWEPALLLSGACLLSGGFVGLLFGVPQKQVSINAKETEKTGRPTTQHDNLVVESAATLGKVLTGFTLGKAGSLIRHFDDLSDLVAKSISGNDQPDSVLAGAIIIYFIATGFLSGLLLPNYFMRAYRD